MQKKRVHSEMQSINFCKRKYPKNSSFRDFALSLIHRTYSENLTSDEFWKEVQKKILSVKDDSLKMAMYNQIGTELLRFIFG